MALYGQGRDISMFRHVNRELMGNIISQQCVYYKYDLADTKVNIYGEASEEKFYHPPVLLNCLIEREDQNYPERETGIIDFQWNITFRFLRDDLLDKAENFNQNYQFTQRYGANLVPEVGDIIVYNKAYYEVYSTNANQYFVGKNPDYDYKDDNGNNPFGDTELDEFGWNTSIIVKTHNIPADKAGITKERF
jgi:hypothetical protein